MLGTIFAAIMKVATKVAICLYVNKIVLTAKIAEYKLLVVYSAKNIVMVTRTIGLAVNPSQSKVTTQSIEA